MRSFKVVVFSNCIECFEQETLSRVDYTASVEGGEKLVYKVIVSQLRGKVKFGIDRGSSYCHYHAKNVNPDYRFVVSQ